MIKNISTEKHFDSIAKDYDAYKENNSYYYNSLKKLLAELMPDAAKRKVLEVGCGTGSLISFLKPKYGVGIDISANMIDIAREKNNNVVFKVMTADDIKIEEKFDYIFLVDVIEHLSDVDGAIKNLHSVSHKDTIIILSMANPMWEPLLMAAEKLRLKMPEGPHNRINFRSLKKILRQNRFYLVSEGTRLLIPVEIPLFRHINSFFYKIPLVRKLGLVEYCVVKSLT